MRLITTSWLGSLLHIHAGARGQIPHPFSINSTKRLKVLRLWPEKATFLASGDGNVHFHENRATILKVYASKLLPWQVAALRQVWSSKGLERCLVAFQQVASLPDTHSEIFSLLSLLAACGLRVNAVIVNASEKKCSMWWNCTLRGHFKPLLVAVKTFQRMQTSRVLFPQATSHSLVYFNGRI